MNSFYVINKENKYLQTRAIVFHHKILDIADNIEKQLTRDGRENYKKFKEIILSDPFAVISQPKTEKQSIIEIPHEFVVNKSSLSINKNCSSEELSEWGAVALRTYIEAGRLWRGVQKEIKKYFLSCAATEEEKIRKEIEIVDARAQKLHDEYQNNSTSENYKKWANELDKINILDEKCKKLFKSDKDIFLFYFENPFINIRREDIKNLTNPKAWVFEDGGAEKKLYKDKTYYILCKNYQGKIGYLIVNGTVGNINEAKPFYSEVAAKKWAKNNVGGDDWAIIEAEVAAVRVGYKNQTSNLTGELQSIFDKKEIDQTVLKITKTKHNKI